MPYRVCKLIEIESGHMLSKHPGGCRFPHGHSRRVEIVLEAATLDDNDMVCDFAVIKRTLQAFIGRFDHAMCINTDDPEYEAMHRLYGDRVIPFEQTDPTSEVIARAIHEAIARRLEACIAGDGDAPPVQQGVRLTRVRVWETSTSWAEYAADH